MTMRIAVTPRLLGYVLVPLALVSGTGVPVDPAQAQSVRMDQPGMALDKSARSQVIDGAIAGLNHAYIYPETAKKMEAWVRVREKAGAYDSVTEASAFARVLTDDLQAVSHDKHLSVIYSQDVVPPDRPRKAPPPPEEAQRELAYKKSVNFGFEKVERLPGNIGYLELRGFMSPDTAGETATAAMTFLADTEALIIDLRRNGGGDPEMVAFLSSYLFDKRTHLNDLYWRDGDLTEEFWTKESVPGKRFGATKPVYVLTSKRTFSAAEEFSYNLKNLKRATIVGVTTGGGAHPGGTMRINDHFAVWVPGGRAISPITKTNWEGTGVLPDIAVAADGALDGAQILALKYLIAREKDPLGKANLERRLSELEQNATRSS